MSDHSDDELLLEELAPLLPALPGTKERARVLELLDRLAENCIDRAARLGPLPLNSKVEKQAHRLKDRVLFVCGAHRSGTTLANQLLDGHSALAVLPSEGTYYTSLHRRVLQLGAGALLKEWIQRLIDPNLAPHFKLGRAPERYIELIRAHTAFLRTTQEQGQLAPHTALLLAWAHVSRDQRLDGVEWLVEKTPGNERYAERLLRSVKDARFLHILRDPRAIYGSQLSLAARHHFSVDRMNVLEGIRRSFVLSLENKHTFGERYRVLRYEELVTDLRAALDPVFTFLRLEFEPICSTQTEAGLPAQHNSSFARPEGVFKESAAPPELPADELEYLSSWTGAAARRVSYEVPALPPGRTTARRAQLIWSSALTRLASVRSPR